MKTKKRLFKYMPFVFLINFFTPVVNAQTTIKSGFENGFINNTSEISGKVFFDENGNGIYDTEDFGLPNQTIITDDGQYITVSDQHGDFRLNVSPGSYKIQTVLSDSQTCSTKEQPTTLANGEQILNYNIGVYSAPSVADLRINMVAVNQPIPGNDNTIKLIYNNVGSANPNTELIFIMDKNYVFSDAIPSPSEINGNLLKWNIAPKAFEKNQIEIHLKLPPSVSLGTVVNSVVKIAGSQNDPLLINNADTLIQLVSNSAPVNNKIVDPTGVVKTFNTVPANVSLVYTIYFQNTTSITSTDVVIIDTLATKLAPGTFMFVGASHPCAIQFSGLVLRFEFLNINLPPSSMDFNGSFGWVQFIVNTGINMYLNDSIKNSADIYFDYASPVRTSEARIDFVNVSAIDEYSRNKTVHVFPNPIDNHINLKLNKPCFDCGFELMDVTGKVILSKSLGIETDYSFERNNVASGFYLYKITQQNSVVQTGKLIAR